MRDEIICVYLHGSRVKGYAAPDSDLDVAVVVDKQLSLGKRIEIVREIQKKYGNKADIKVVSRRASPVFLFEIIGGKCMYKKSDLDRVNFEAFAMRNYYDTQHMRDIYSQYLYAN